MKKPHWITLEEAKKLTGYSRTSLYKMRKTGEIRSRNRKGKVQYEENSLNKIFNYQ